MSSYERCPGCLEEMMDSDTHICSNCGGSLIFQPKSPAPSPASEGEVADSTTIYLLTVESVDVGGYTERYARDAYATKELAAEALDKANAQKAEREKRRLEKGKPCGAVESFSIEEVGLTGAAPSLPAARSVVSEEMARIVLAKYFGTNYNQTDMAVADMRAALSAALSQGGGGGDGWIPCAERMPEYGLEVLIYPSTGRQRMAYWDEPNDDWADGEGGAWDADEVTHWRTLPKPPAQADGGEKS